jgi:hypothetical protein
MGVEGKMVLLMIITFTEILHRMEDFCVHLVSKKAFVKRHLKCGFLNKSFILNAPLCQLPISSHPFWVGATANPPKTDDWKWATDKRCINNK